MAAIAVMGGVRSVTVILGSGATITVAFLIYLTTGLDLLILLFGVLSVLGSLE